MAESIKTIILDFYGLPGSGKTTISHEVAERLTHLSYDVVEPSYDYDHKLKPIHRKIKKIFDTLCYSITHVRCFLSITRIVRDNTTSGVISFSDIINIATKIAMIEKYHEKKDYIIFDEGIAQAAISLAINKTEKVSNVFQEICKLLDEPYCIRLIQVECDRNLALDRVLKRNSKDTRVERMNSEVEMKQFMEKFEESIEIINTIAESSFVLHCNCDLLEDL